MKRRVKWRPWQFSLRFLLGVTALVAVGAAFFGWRARQLEPQRRAVARIVELGGSVEMEGRGWIDAIAHGCEFDEVVRVTLPGHLGNEVLPDLKALPALRHVTLEYSTLRNSLKRDGNYFGTIMGDFDSFVVDAPASDFSRFPRDIPRIKSLSHRDERARCERVQNQLPEVVLEVSRDGVIMSVETAFERRFDEIKPLKPTFRWE